MDRGPSLSKKEEANWAQTCIAVCFVIVDVINSPPTAVVPSLPGWAVSLELGARINLPFIKLLLSDILP